MNIIDFEYDGIALSSLNMIPCYFTSGSDEVEIGNKLDMGNVRPAQKDKWFSIGAKYDSPLEISFDICKNPCSTENIEPDLSEEEIAYIMRWLNRKKYCKFKPIYENNEYTNIYFMATFNINLQTAMNKVIGFSLTLMTDSPYGYEDVVLTPETSFVQTLTVTDTSEELGYLYPEMQIKVQSAGNLTITNSADPENIVSMKNCLENEVLTFHGELKQITTNKEAHTKLPNDFNYRYPRLFNDMTNRANTYTFSIPCQVMKLTFKKVRKVGLIL